MERTTVYGRGRPPGAALRMELGRILVKHGLLDPPVEKSD